MKTQHATFATTIKHVLEREFETLIGWTSSPIDGQGRTLGLGMILLDTLFLGLASYGINLILTPGDWPGIGGFFGLAGIFTGLFVAARIVGTAVLDSRS